MVSPSWPRGWFADVAVPAVVTADITAAAPAVMRLLWLLSLPWGRLALLPGLHLLRMALLLVAATTIIVAPV